MKLRRENKAAGSTLIELMMSLGIFSVAGGLIFASLNTATVLYAKNTSINTAHAQMIKALERVNWDVICGVGSCGQFGGNEIRLRVKGTNAKEGINLVLDECLRASVNAVGNGETVGLTHGSEGRSGGEGQNAQCHHHFGIGKALAPRFFSQEGMPGMSGSNFHSPEEKQRACGFSLFS